MKEDVDGRDKPGHDEGGHDKLRHMWTAPIGKHFLAYQTIWSASVICPACWCGLMTAGPDEIRLPWSLSLRRALRLVTLSGCPWLSVLTVSFITSFVLTK